MGFSSTVALGIVAATTACGTIDSCLDQGGHWNESAKACEFVSGSLTTPGDAIAAGTRTLEFAYGRNVLDQEPFVAELDGDVWYIHGTLPDGMLGGVAEVWIDRDSGRVRRILHGQ